MNLVSLAARNLRRNPGRTALTVLGVATTIVGFVLLRTIVAAWHAGVEHAAQDRIGTRHKVSFIIPLPRRYVETLRSTEGVTASTWANWFGGINPRNENDFFASMAVDHESFMNVYDEVELAPEQMQAWRETKSGAVIGSDLARRLNLSVGDRFTLKGTIYPGDWPFEIVGIYTASRRSFDQQTFLFRWDYMNERIPETERDQVGWIVSRVRNARGSAALSQRIDRAFESQDVPTITMSERAMNLSFMGMFANVIKALNVVSVIILLILLMLLGNTISMGVRERTQEYGVLRALGFLPKHIVLFIVGEAAALGLLSGLVGLALAYPLIQFALARFFAENLAQYFPPISVEPGTIALALALGVALGFVSAIVPAYGASRLTVTGALRRLD